MDETAFKVQLKATFNTVSEGYDGQALRFFSRSAEHLVACLDLNGDERVLDVATGTGHTALSIAARVPQGRVTGVDLAPGMLERARQKAAALNLANVEFIKMDMEALGFAEDSFDVAACAFGIFFVEDMVSLLSRIAKVVKPGGRVAIATFQQDYFQPLAEMLLDRLAGYGIQRPTQGWKRVATEAGCRALFKQAGLRNINVVQQNVGYYLESADDWWDIVCNAGFRMLIDQLPATEQEQFRCEHLLEIDALKATDGIWLDVGILITVGELR